MSSAVSPVRKLRPRRRMARSVAVRWAAILMGGAALAVGQTNVQANSQAPFRIVSTAPSITELLYALGLGDRVVGVDRFSRFPPAALQKPKIGDYVSPNLEAIAALKPDL